MSRLPYTCQNGYYHMWYLRNKADEHREEKEANQETHS